MATLRYYGSKSKPISIRMLFVADRIPAELRRIVEFLNEQMDPAEVLARISHTGWRA